MIEDVADEGKPTLKEFWKRFSIMHGVNIIIKSWEEVTEHSLYEYRVVQSLARRHS